MPNFAWTQGCVSHIGIEQDRHAELPRDVDESAATVTDEGAEGPLDLAARHGVFQGRVMASVLEDARSALRAFLRSASFNRTLVRRFVAMLASTGGGYYAVTLSVISRAFDRTA